MNAGPSMPGLAVAALSVVDGGRDAQRLMHALRGGCAPADLLMDALQRVEIHGDAHRTRGFLREIQKHLERAAE